MTRQSYEKLDGLSAIYLEDSWVLEIIARPSSLRFDLEAVLTSEHPAYVPPPATQQHCYRRASLEFARVRRLDWADQGRPPATDASGQVDYGNIDSLLADQQRYEIEGLFGHIDVWSDPPTLDLLDPPPA